MPGTTSSLAKPPPPPPRRMARVPKLLAVALLLAAVSLVGAEALARRVFEPPLEPYTLHPLFHLVRTPKFKQTKWSIEEPAYTFVFEANVLGFRGRSMQTVEKPAGTYRIFFVGASTTENQHLPEEKTFAGIVEARLTDALHGSPRVEVANCGIAGFGIARSLSLIEHQILKLEPDLIIVLDAENDMMSSIDPRWEKTNAFLRVNDTTFKEWLCRESRLVGVLNNALTRKEDDTRRFFDRARKRAQSHRWEVPNVQLDRYLPYYTQYLRWIALVCRDAKMPVVFMTQPTLWKDKNTDDERAAMWMSDFALLEIRMPPDTCAQLMARYNAAIKETAAIFDAPVVDLAAAVPKDLVDFSDDAHLTAEGNVRVADAILATILKDGKLPSRPK